MHIYEVTEPKESYKVKVASLANLLSKLPKATTRKIHSNTVWKNPATDPCDYDEKGR